MLERVARGRPERSMVLTGLRGVGKTVLLNTFKSMAMQRLWGTGKIEARPDQSIRRPVAAALHMAIRELAPGTAPPSASRSSSACSRRSRCAIPPRRRAPRTGRPASTCPPRAAGPTPATWRST
ncbi:hypothetical protein GCM10027612_10750 [Microbispora bryophytorum subsp. camponoti]